MMVHRLMLFSVQQSVPLPVCPYATPYACPYCVPYTNRTDQMKQAGRHYDSSGGILLPLSGRKETFQSVSFLIGNHISDQAVPQFSGLVPGIFLCNLQR